MVCSTLPPQRTSERRRLAGPLAFRKRRCRPKLRDKRVKAAFVALLGAVPA